MAHDIHSPVMKQCSNIPTKTDAMFSIYVSEVAVNSVILRRVLDT